MRVISTILLCIIGAFIEINACKLHEVEDIPRPYREWDNTFDQRIFQMWGERVYHYKIHPNDPTEDCGKRYWSRLLAKLYYTDSHNLTIDHLIEEGHALVESKHAGSFRKPFSCAGFAMYYFNWKDSIEKYDPAQIQVIHERVDTMWHYLLRTDHLLDACCGYNQQGGKEFNSENFQWMLKVAGYLFAHELHLKSINGNVVDMTAKDVDNIEIHTGKSHPRVEKIAAKSVDIIAYFDNSLKNLTRALYNAGRVEWNSNNYFGHTLNPLHTMYQCAEKCGDPNAIENKKRAKACIDWMLTEAALHYRDGFQVAADSRAKNGSFLPFKGSYYQYTIPYFADKEHYPSCGDTIWSIHNPGDAEIGFLTTSSYRPPQVLIDIAQKNFALPVEIQSAKPFYHIDKGNFFNIDGTTNDTAAYADWNGQNLGRRYEFETLYISDNFTMSSVAAGRPDGHEGTFSEQCLWRIGIDGDSTGCIMFSGNAGDMTTTTGRYPWHEIGQYRNMMMHLIKSPYNNRIWIAVPKRAFKNNNSGNISLHDIKGIYDGKNIFIEMQHNVYVALRASAGTTINIVEDYQESSEHYCIEFCWDNGSLGCLVIEIDDKKGKTTFETFVNKTLQREIKINDNTCQYENESGNSIKMNFVAPKPYLMTQYTYDTPPTNPIPYGGTYPQIYTDGKPVDFTTWDSYKTIFGYPVVTQKWGSGELELKSRNYHAKIKIDPQTAKVKYFSK